MFNLVSNNARYSDNFHYATIGYLSVQKVLRVVKPGPQDVFCDIGSGMGRILCVVAREPVRKCVGVELLESLCQIARRNAISLRGRKAPIQIVCGDATTVDLSEGTIYFMFNPFGGETLARYPREHQMLALPKASGNKNCLLQLEISIRA